MSWEEIEKSIKKEGSMDGESVFLKLKDSEEVTGVFMGDPVKIYRAPYGTKDFKIYKEWEEGRVKKYRINFIQKTKEGYKPLIWEFGSGAARTLLEQKNEYGLEAVFKLKRSGEGKQTTYPILFKEKLTKDQMKKLNEIKLPNLLPSESSQAAKEFENENVPSFDSEDEIDLQF